jgi:prepilin-type N-terminal cleavage/methylation domain-containing protein
MTDDGYTLAEMLAALAILGMAVGGLGLVTSLIARQQLAAHRISIRLAEERAADRALGLWLADQDPASLSGDDRRLSAACGPAICTARLEADRLRTVLILQGRSRAVRRLRLRQPRLRFSYSDGLGQVAVWPQPGKDEEGAKAAVPRTLVLAAANDIPLAVARVWPREPRDCQFDAIAGACRGASR